MILYLLLLALACSVLASADAQSPTFDRQDRDYRPLQKVIESGKRTECGACQVKRHFYSLGGSEIIQCPYINDVLIIETNGYFVHNEEENRMNLRLRLYRRIIENKKLYRI
ncbi:hypothetical protein DICVIV_00807 [Dictyocaulus viviparus]|uniref:Uncharacterized protein n=1 Tax=Dictyocaulus viviparus TaxID=29172 RepID=A0A0D8Y7V7_DICVI|nr:hypothetical protein DICVIV_00807 [Dictyocaulus viviparus]